MATLQQCPTCGKHMDPGARFCPNDGTPLSDTAAGTRTPTGRETQRIKLDLPVVVGNRYKLLELRGGGGMARVYRGIDTTLEREVAVKLINPDLRADPEFDARFQREARIASQLADPHIVVVHDFGIDPEHGPYLVMEYLRGESLRERLSQHGVLPLKAALQLCGQVLLALIHAHEKGIVHRDIKPDNIFLLNQSGVRLHVRVLDFGIARIYRDDDPGRPEPLTEPGAVMGTPRYMSPEQLAGKPVDARSDLYSAALVIHEALTGQLPYVTGKKLTELCLEATPALQELIEHCLKPEPESRPASAIEVYLRLQELGKASGVLLLPPGAMEKLLIARHQAADPTGPYRPADEDVRRSRRRVILGIAAVVALIVIVVGAWAIFKDPAPSAEKATGESLLGIRIGDTREQATKKLDKIAAGPRLKPWGEEPGDAPLYLGHTLRVADIGKDVLDRADVLLSTDERVCLVLVDDVVRAMVVRAPHRASTARGLRMADKVGELFKLYPESADVRDEDVAKTTRRTGRGHIEVRRYDTLGIGFEVLDQKISAITLYPPTMP